MEPKDRGVSMTGKELLEWLQEIPESELASSQVVFDALPPGKMRPLVTAKLHTLIHTSGEYQKGVSVIYLVYK